MFGGTDCCSELLDPSTTPGFLTPESYPTAPRTSSVIALTFLSRGENKLFPMHLVAEAAPILRGIRIVIDSGLVPALVDLTNLGNAPSVDVGTVTSNILGLIRGYPISIVFVGRNANYVAHSLARLALSLSVDQFFS
ncbi:hypothetical protein Ddye_001809 [Dipteronia dyeriana]|uniref:Uncharacterized protein n=1 Tax=Dipteronia dyeriana TaxID=168575 RepID=A0AAE0CTR3_9ROSI|nr:hypothetical protein Ddye_001809 [Dipteronia dyeriana]